jgi:hypothetical protein
MLLGYHYALRQQAKLLAKERIEIQKRKDSALQQATLLAEHKAMHRTETEGIIGMDQDMRISGIQKGKVSRKTLTRPSYRSTIKETLYQKPLKQHWWQLKHTCIQHDLIQEI